MIKNICYIDYDLTTSPSFDRLVLEFKKNNIEIFTIISKIEPIKNHANMITVFEGEKNQISIEKACKKLKKSLHDCFIIYSENEIKLTNFPKHQLFEIKKNDKDCFFHSLESIIKYFQVMRIIRLLLFLIVIIIDLLLFYQYSDNYIFIVSLIILNGFTIYLLFYRFSIIIISYFFQIFIEIMLQS